MSATTRAVIATFTGVGLVFGGALFAAGSAMASAHEPSDESSAANMCPPGLSYNYSTGKCGYGSAGQGPQSGASATGSGGAGK